MKIQRGATALRRALALTVFVAMMGATLAVPTAASADTLVTLSGTVTNADGSPAVGSVAFTGSSTGGVSTSTDASGHYVLHVVAGDSGALEFGLQLGAVGALRAVLGFDPSAKLNIGAADQIEDYAWPAPAQVIAHVVDSHGDAIAGASVHPTPGVVGGHRPDGTSMGLGWSVNPGALDCTTNASGQCTVPAVVGLPMELNATTPPISVMPGDPSYPQLVLSGSTTAPIATASSTATVTIDTDEAAADLVTLSGTVTRDGAPVSDTGVSFAGTSSVSDADGHYALHVPAGSSGQLRFVLGIAPHGYLQKVFGSGVGVGPDFAVGAVDRIQDLAWPSPAVVTPRVVDSGGAPIAGAQVQLSPNAVFDHVMDGMPTTALSWQDAAIPSCTTDASGECPTPVPAVLGLPMELSATTPLISVMPGDPSYPQLVLSGSTTAPIATASSTATVAIDTDAAAADLVTLSGTVTRGGVPVPETGVSFAGVSATSDADGHYALHVPAGSSGQLRFLLNVAPYGYLQKVFGSGVGIGPDFAVGAVDRIQDLAWPSPAVVTARVVDSGGAPIAGAQVQLSPNIVFDHVMDGMPTTALSWQLSDPSILNCTTGASGACPAAIPAFQGLPMNMTASRALVPGDPSWPTFSGDTTTPVATALSTATVTMSNLFNLPSAGSRAGTVLVAASGSTTLSNQTTAPLPDGLLPDGSTAPVGAVGYQVHNVAVGGTVSVFLALPPGATPTEIDKLVSGHLVDVSSIATISGNVVTLHLRDGGLGDADGIANGVIVDPVVPVVAAGGAFRVTTTHLPGATRLVAYGPVQLTYAGAGASAAGFVTTVKWKKVSLPKGMKVTKTGLLTGTPNKKVVAGSTSVKVQVTETVTTRNGKKKVKTKTTVLGTIPLTVG